MNFAQNRLLLLTSRGGIRYSIEYQAVLDQWASLSIPLPTTARRAKDDLHLRTVKDLGVLTLLDVYYPICAHHEDAATINWKTPSSNRITKVNSPTFTINSGFTGNGTSSYLNTNWATSSGVRFLQNNCSLGGHTPTNNARNSDSLFGFWEGGFDKLTRLDPRGTGGDLDVVYWGLLNPAATNDTGANASAVGFYHMKRTGANTTSLFKNGVSIDTGANTSQTRSALSVFLLALNSGGGAVNFSQRRISSFFAGASLNGLELAFYNEWNRHFTSL